MNLEKLKETARRFEQKEEWRKAIEVYLKAIQEVEAGRDTHPDLAVYNRVGDLYVRLNDTNAAIRAYERAADLYAEQGFFNNAIALCGKILRINPARNQVYLKLAHLHARKNVSIEAKRNLLAYIDRMHAAGQLDEAFASVKAYADEFASNQELRAMLVDLLRAASRDNEARDELARMAAALEARGDAVAAQQTRDQLVEIHVDFDAPQRELPPAAAMPVPVAARPPAAKNNDLIFLDTGLDVPLVIDAAASLAPSIISSDAMPVMVEGPVPDLPTAQVAPGKVQDGQSVLGGSFAGMDVPMIDTGLPLIDTALPDALDEAGAGGASGGVEIIQDLEPASAAGTDALEGLERMEIEPSDGIGASSLEGLESTAVADDGVLNVDGLSPELDSIVLDDGAGPIEAAPLAGFESTIFADHVPPELSVDVGGPDSVEAALEADAAVDVDGLSETLEMIELEPASPEAETEEQPATDDGAQTFAAEDYIDLGDPAAVDGAAEEASQERAAPALDEPLPPDHGDVEMHDELDAAFAGPAIVDEPVESVGAVDEAESVDLLEDAPVIAEAMTNAVDAADELPPATLDVPTIESTTLEAEPEPEPEPEPALEIEPDPEAVAEARTEPAPALVAPELLDLEAPALPPLEQVPPPATARTLVEELEDQILESPDDPALHQRLGEALLETGDGQRAAEEFGLGLQAYEAQEAWDAAAYLADRLVELRPEAIRFYQKRVELAFRRKDREELIEAYLSLGDALVRGGAMEKALAVYQRVLDHDEGNQEAARALATYAPPPPPPPVEAAAPAGQDFVDLGAMLVEADLPPARDTRMRVRPTSPTGDEQQDFDDMLAAFKRGIESNLAADDYEAHYDLGVAFKEMGLLDEAISEFQKALRAPTGRLRTSEALAMAFYEKGQLPIAEAVLRRAVDSPIGMDDEKLGLLYWLGRVLEEQGKGEDSIAFYERALAIDIHFMDVADRMHRVTAGRQA